MLTPKQLQDMSEKFDEELEQCLLSSALVSQGDVFLDPWTAEFEEYNFYLESHRMIWAEMKRQFEVHGQFNEYTIRSAFINQLVEGGRVNHHKLTSLTSLLTALQREYVRGERMTMPAFAHQYATQLRDVTTRREIAVAHLEYLQCVHDTGDEDRSARRVLDATVDSLQRQLTTYDAEDDIDVLLEGMENNKVLTGFTAFDDEFHGIPSSGMTIIAARPSVGKSAYARRIIQHLSRDRKIFWYSEDQSKNDIYNLEMARALKTATDKIRDLPSDRRRVGLKYVRDGVWNGNVTIVDTPHPLQSIVQLIHREHPDCVVIDYLQLIDAGQDGQQANVSETSRALKRITKQYGIPVLALAQFNRQYRPGETPQLKWLRDSGQIEQDADCVIAIERDTSTSTESQEATVFVLKNKVGPTGRVGVVWHGKYASYENKAAGQFR